jgi:putative FmdB family regulatory protein
MPTYEYECEKCGKIFDVFQSMTAEPLKTCSDPACRGPVHRIVSGGAGFLFKGSGFYITDYRSESYKKSVEKEKKGADTPGSPTGTSSKDSSSKSPGPSTSSGGEKKAAPAE